MSDFNAQKNGYKKYRAGIHTLPFAEVSGSDRIHFLPTGSSDAILLESDGHFALVDCAEDNDNPRGFEELNNKGYEEEVLSYLKKHASGKDGKVRLDFILGTHAHSDHLGGFDTLLSDEDIIVGRAYLKRYEESIICLKEIEKWDNREVYEQTVEALKKRNVPIISEIDTPEFMLGNMDIRLFNTEYDTVHSDIGENDNSIGMLIRIYGTWVFLAADIDNKTGDEDLIAPEVGKVDILKVGHHSYAHSSTENFLRILNPNVCIVTNNYESTDKRTLDRIIDICHSPILVTGEENGVLAVFYPDKTVSFYNGIM